MARIWPSRWLHAEDRSAGSAAEHLLYDALSSLPQDFAVYHDVSFMVSQTAGRGRTPKRRDFQVDFLVTHRSLGALSIEVKAGPVTVGPDGWGRLSDVGWMPMDDPLVQMRDNRGALERHLMEQQRWTPGRDFAMAAGMAFPQRADPWLDGVSSAPPPLVATALDLSRMEDWVRSLFRFVWPEGPPTDSALAADLLHGMFCHELPIPRRLTGIGSAVAETETRIHEFTEQQLRVYGGLRSNPRVQVTGPAGSGKTLLAMRRARDLAETGERVLFTCFNKLLADHITGLIGRSSGIDVLTFHQLVRRLVVDAGGRFEPPRAEVVGRGEEGAWWRETAPELAFEALTHPSAPRYDAIVVDESQDFADDWWVVLEALFADAADACLWTFGDDNQRIYGEPSRGPQGMMRLSLTENLRNTQRIFATFSGLVDQQVTVAGTPVGEPVQWVETDGGGSMLTHLSDVLFGLVSQGVRESDIVVLTGMGSTSSELRDLSHVGDVPIRRYRAGMPREHVTWETVRRFKGLEAPVLVLCELAPLLEAEDELRYTALSRPTSLLCVVGDRRELREMKELGRRRD